MRIIAVIIFILAWAILVQFTLRGLKNLAKWFDKNYSDIKPLTILIGLIEIIATALITKFFIDKGTPGEKIFSQAALLLAAWFAIKTLAYHPGYKDDKKEILDESAERYKYIIGTLLAVLGGVVLGMILASY